MNNITMTVELCPEDRARLDAILEALQHRGQSTAAEPMAEAAPVVEEAPKAEPEKAPEPVAETADPVTEDLPGGEPAEVTAEDILSLVQKLAAPTTGKREACKAIIKKYAGNVSGIPADKRREVMGQLLDLAAGEG